MPLPCLRTCLACAWPQVLFFSGEPALQASVREAALADLLALAEADGFVGTASSHYSAVAAMLRFVRGYAPLMTAPSIATGRASATKYVDERGVAFGSFAVGLLHSGNLPRAATSAEKHRRWRSAAARLLGSHAVTTANLSARRRSIDGSCADAASFGLRWQHSPGPAPRVSLAAFECARWQLAESCPAWHWQRGAGGTPDRKSVV